MSAARLRVGIAGTGIRSTHLATAVRSDGRARLVAVQDPFEQARARFAAEHSLDVACASFAELLEHVDVAILTSPAQHHVPQACEALAHGVHVLSEVPAAVSHEQALELVAAVRASDAVYALGENYCYFPANVAVGELVRRGELGDVYFGESELFADIRAQLRDPAGAPTWKQHWWTGRDGHTDPTHSLGPLLQWFDDRVAAVSCVGAGRHAGSEHELQDMTVLLARTVRGSLLRLGFSWLAPRPLLSHSYRLQGTLGAYDQGDPRRGVQPAVFFGEQWPEGEIPDLLAHTWEPLEPLVELLLPERYAQPEDLTTALDASTAEAWALHDLWMLQDFLDAALERRAPELDVYAALDMTLPSFAAEASIAQGGAWVAVPNPRFLTAGIGADPGPEAPLA